MNKIGDKPVLYYPYIHIRSEHWLKATLLCAPAVKRIVPDTYTPEDLPNIVRYTEIQGPNGALLQAVPAFSEAASEAQHRLLCKLRENEKLIRRKFQRQHAPSPDEYWIHDAKFSYELIDYLERHRLAWHSWHSEGYGRRTWYALHPVLGSAIMTTIGLSIAREQDYDIVTPSTEFHEAILATKEDEIFDALLNVGKPQQPLTPAQVRHDLGQMVIALSGVNYQALRPEAVPELQSSKCFRKFQSLIRTKVQNIEPDQSPEAYRAELQREAMEIIEAWRDTRADVSGALRDTLFQQGLALSPVILMSLLKGPDVTELAAAGGVAVALVISKGRRLSRKQRTDPNQYLTEIKKAESELLRITFPLGLSRE